MPVYKSPILILRCQDWSETSQIVHVLAREIGRLRCLAKGSKRGQNPFSGPLDRWTLGDAVFSQADPNRLATLMELYETERFDGIRRRLPAFYGASCITEIILTIVPDLEAQPAVFDLVVDGLRLLAAVEVEACRAVTLTLVWRLLALLGYVPRLDQCAECGAAISLESPLNFSSGLGGPVCGNCHPPGRIHHLTAKAAQAIAFLLSAGWDEVRRVRLTEATADLIRGLLSARIEELAGRKLSALRYV